MRINIVKLNKYEEICWDLWFILDAMEKSLNKEKKDKETCLFYCSREISNISDQLKKIDTVVSDHSKNF